MKKDTTAVKHPLLGFVITNESGSFGSWRRQFEAPGTTQQKIGLLYWLGTQKPLWRCGWNEFAYGQVLNMAGYLLSLADGFHHSEPSDISTGDRYHLQGIAAKARAVLCSSFFSQILLGTPREQWSNMASLCQFDDFVEKVVRFFSIKESDRKFSLRNCPDLSDKPDQEEMRHFNSVKNFLIALAHQGWGHNGNLAKNEAARFRPRFVDFLSRYDELNFLLGKELDEPCLARLRQIALSRHVKCWLDAETFNLREPASSLEEALRMGSPAAQVIKNHEVRLAAVK